MLKILSFPNPILKKKSKAVKKVTPEIVKLMDEMLEMMRKAPGVGLAAPQIGESIRVIVAELSLPAESRQSREKEGLPEKETVTLQLANPKILKKSGKQTILEGCLCFLGVEAPVERASHVSIKALDRNGKTVEIEADGLLATILQHEIDHLDGILFIDRVKDPSLIRHVPPETEKKEELI